MAMVEAVRIQQLLPLMPPASRENEEYSAGTHA